MFYIINSCVSDLTVLEQLNIDILNMTLQEDLIIIFLLFYNMIQFKYTHSCK